MLLSTILIFSTHPLNAETKSNKPLKVLFIGNSLTFFHNINDLVGQIAYHKNRKVRIDEYLPGSTVFSDHYGSKECLGMIRNNKYDVVVLQSSSFEPVSNPEELIEYGKKLYEEINKSGARTVFFMTWEYKGMPDWIKKSKNKKNKKLAEKEIPNMYSHIKKAYLRLAEDTGAELSPVGTAWNMMRKEVPDIILHDKDNSHPSEYGSVLSAIVLYSSIFQDEPKGMPTSYYPYKRDKDPGAKDYSIKIEFAEKIKMEQIAAKAIKETKALLAK